MNIMKHILTKEEQAIIYNAISIAHKYVTHFQPNNKDKLLVYKASEICIQHGFPYVENFLNSGEDNDIESSK